MQQELLLQEVARIRGKMKRLGARKLRMIMKPFMADHHIDIGRDKFFDLLRENSLLIRKRKRSKPVTTFSQHWLHKYPNLIIDFIPTCANQLWVGDITYIRIGDSFGYLSLITDGYSRKILGFYLSVDLSAKGCIAALKMAMENNPEINSLTHHSDRGVQYCSADYVGLLQKNNIAISMTQSGDPLENALAERVNGILKDELLEEIYSDFDQARQAVAVAISTYNYYRPHSSIDMLTPVKAHLKSGELIKHWKSYYVTQRKEVAMM